MKIWHYTSVLFLFAFSCFIANAGTNRNWQVKISGMVENMTGKSGKAITAINCNPWSDETSRHAVRIDSSGCFNTFIEIPYGHTFTIYYDKTFFCQYAEPGDSIFITIDASRLKSGALYSGAHEKLNNEYGKAYAELIERSYVELPSREMPKEEYLDYFLKINSELEETLENYADSVGMGDNSRDLMRRSLLFNVANGAIEHKDKSAQRELEFLESPIFGLDDEDNLREMMFPFHLQEYLNKLTEVLKPDSIGQLIDAIAERHPKSLNRDVMLAKLLKDEYDGNDHAIIARKLFTDSGVFEMIYGNKTENSKLPDIGLFEGSICEFRHGTITDSGYTNLVELIRREFEGKVVYLDFWATWCGPCIEANKSLPEVAEFFKDKDVVFVSVALKSDFDKWGKLVRRHPETCKDYFIKNDADAELIMSAFGINGFPSYRIINRDSEIISNDPPRPGNPAIYDFLTGIL